MSKKCTDILKNVRNDDLILRDISMKNDLVNIFQTLHNSYLNSLGRLNTYQNAHASLLLEFEFYLQKDIQFINKCILNEPFCFLQHKTFRCTKKNLTSQKEFLLNFLHMPYEKVSVKHINCLHERNGMVSKMSHLMFMINNTVYKQIGRILSIFDKPE